MILVATVLLISFAAGRLTTGSLHRHVWSKPEHLFISFAVGYGFLALILYFAGLAGFFGQKFIATAGIISLMGSVIYLTVVCRQSRLSFTDFFESFKPRLLVLWVAALGGLLVLGSFLPPTAHDALCYHLNIPRRWAQDGVIGYYPYLVNSLFPFLIQVYYGVAILFNSDYTAHFFHLACLFGTLVGVYALGRRDGKQAGWLAALILISTPGIFNQSNLPLNDIALMFFSYAMTYAVFLGMRNNFSARFFLVAGALGGFALGIKYLAVLHIVSCAIAALFIAYKDKVPFSRVVRSAGLFSMMAAAVGGVWYLRSWLLEGNPLYPYFGNLFGTADSAGYDFAKQGYGKSIIDFLFLPWRATMEPQNFGGTWAQSGIVYLVFLPLLFSKDKSGDFQFFKITIIAYFLMWFYLVQNLRFLYFVLPVLAVLVAIKSQGYRYILYGIIALNTVFAVYHSKDAALYFAKNLKPAEYLNKVDATYPLVQEVNKYVNTHERILVDDLVRLYYLDAEPVRAAEFFKRRQLNWSDDALPNLLIELKVDRILIGVDRKEDLSKQFSGWKQQRIFDSHVLLSNKDKKSHGL